MKNAAYTKLGLIRDEGLAYTAKKYGSLPKPAFQWYKH